MRIDVVAAFLFALGISIPAICSWKWKANTLPY